MEWEKDPKKIVLKLQKSRSLLKELFETIPEDRWFAIVAGGEWTVSDTVIHLIGWDEYLVNQAKEWLQGIDPTDPNLSEDQYNREYIKSHPVKSKNEGIAKFEESTTELFRFLNELSEDEIKYALENESLVDLDLYEHDMEHYNSIKKVI
jgi:hypothetical protein